MVAALNLIGQKFGRLTPVCDLGPNKHGKRQWQFNCDCGNIATATGSEVKKGKIVSCGCRGREVGRANAIAGRLKIAAAKTTHGQHGKPEYFVWKTMRQRILNPNSADYPQYGGRGITICERWNKYENFIADMGGRPSDNHSIDRIDCDGPYSPDNCRWATATEQRLNQRRNKNGNITSITQ